MLCTPAEIDRKRRLAKQKLLEKQARSNNRINQSTSSAPSSPVISKHFAMKSKPLQTPIQYNNSPPKVSNSNALKFREDSKITATLVLNDHKRFQVKLSKYFSVAIDVMKTIPSKSYNAKTSHWSFSLEDYDLLLSKFEPLLSQLLVIKLPPWIHKLNKYKTTETPCYDFSVIDTQLMDTLMPFQEEGLCFAIEREGRCFIADEMGLGKTIQALAIASYYRQDWPILIISTASTCASWESTICKYIPTIPIMNIQMISAKSDYIDNPTVVITSYDMMTRRIDELLVKKFGICIFDESHILRNFKTKCFKSAIALSKVAKRVILLSGTPALSKPSELFTQLQLLDESFFGNFIEYSKRYCDGKESAFGWDSSGQSNLEELQIVLDRFMIRRTKAGMSSLNLPDKIQEIIHLELSTANLNAQQAEELQRLAGTDFNKVIKNDQQILPFFHNTSKIKMGAVCSYIAQLLKEEKRKALIFAHHVNMLDGLEKVLKNSRKNYIRIEGKTTNRQELVKQFQNNENVRYALLSITAANAGITLTAAQIVIFTELHWTPSILAQAEARAHRIGQTEPVTIRYLIGKKTVDDYIWPMLQRKQKTLNQMNLTSETYDNIKLSKKELQPLVLTNNICKYFSPVKRSQEDSDCNGSSAKKIRNCNSEDSVSSINTNTNVPNNHVAEASTPNDRNMSDKLEEFDDDFDELLTNISTQQVNVAISKPHISDDLFDDDMDELFKTIPI